MLPFPVRALASAAVFGAAAGAALGATVRIQADQDATIQASNRPEPALANGAGANLFAGTDQVSVIARTLLRFPIIEHVPAGSEVTGARLILSLETGIGDAALYPLAASWSEGPSLPEIRKQVSTDAREGDATWFYRYYARDEEDRVSWQQAGGDALGQQPVAFAVRTLQAYVWSGDAFRLEVQRLVARPDLNYGWLILGTESAVQSLLCFASREHPAAALRPVLEIDYQPPSELTLTTLSFGPLVTVAGRGQDTGRESYWKPGMEGGDALDAELSRPNAAAADRSGRVYVADTYAHAIRRIDPDGKIRTVAGTGSAGFNGDGPALEVQLNQPTGLFVLPDGAFYLLDASNNRICRVGTDGQLHTLVQDPAGIGGRGLWVSPDESFLYYSARTEIRRWEAGNGPEEVTTVGGGFQNVGHLDVRSGDGAILAADADREKVFLVQPDGSRVVVAGGTKLGTGLPALETRLLEPRAVAWLGNGAYLIGTKGDGRLWHVDTAGIANVMLEGQSGRNLRSGEGTLLRTLTVERTPVMSELYDVRLTPDGSLLLTTNDSGCIRAVRRAPAPPLGPVFYDAEAGITLTWAAQIGVTYLIDRSPDLRSWARRSQVTAAAALMQFTDGEAASGGEGYYRIRVYP